MAESDSAGIMMEVTRNYNRLFDSSEIIIVKNQPALYYKRSISGKVLRALCVQVLEFFCYIKTTSASVLSGTQELIFQIQRPVSGDMFSRTK